MANQNPFTAHIRVVPNRGLPQDTAGPSYKEQGAVRKYARFDHVRDLQRLASRVYGELENVATITLPIPGGGQFRAYGSYSSLQNGTAVKPQIGQTPALLMIEGFYTADNAEDQPYAMKPIIHTGNLVYGRGGAWDNLAAGAPLVAVQQEVLAIKTLIESAISTVSDDSGVALALFRLQYKSATWGDGGHHFPV